MKKAILAGLLLLAACGPNATGPNATGNDSGSGSNLQLVTQALTPICEKTLKGKEIIPEEAVKFGIDEKAVCECGLSKTEGKLVSDPARILKLITEEDEQVKFLTEVGSECAGELLQKAISDNAGKIVDNILNPSGSK